MFRAIPKIVFVLLLATGTAFADSRSPIISEFPEWRKCQDIELQRHLESLFPEDQGYLITGPLAPDMARIAPGVGERIFSSQRVICPDPASLSAAVTQVVQSDLFRSVRVYIAEALIDTLYGGYRGVLAVYTNNGEEKVIQLNTVNQTRWLIWRVATSHTSGNENSYYQYSIAVSDYLYAVDSGQEDAKEPRASSFGLPQNLDFYPPRPEYVIEGYANYKEFLYRHREIITDFARGIEAFIPTDSLLSILKANVPRVAYFNKEAPLLQYEYRKFFERGGDVRVMRTLTPDIFIALAPGEYFFAIGLSEKIRFSRELPREEVGKIEKETGKKVPRANHAFLFPGEPVLTAGAFFIEGQDPSHLAQVNAHSGHYFYSNTTATIREDITVHGNEYLLTLGHFFNALDSLGISYNEILINKL